MEYDEIVEVLDRGKSIDVQTSSSFDTLMISSRTLERLQAHGFNKPSPVQEKAIPVGLMGRDMLVQAKSGTGKTLVFSVLAVENVDPTRRGIQKLIVSPTREIATQIRETVKKLAPSGTRIMCFVGGVPLKEDLQNLKNNVPHIVIGTTGRICQLVQKNVLNFSKVDFFVLDEADKLMDDCFKDDIHFIMSSLPPMRQIAVFSATYPRKLDKLLATFLRDAALVRFNSEDVQLVGIKQYVITNCLNINESLEQVLKTVQYSQVLVFCDTVERCEPTCSYLVDHGFQASYISSAMEQKERQKAIDDLRYYRTKILVSSDLTARGIDADRVNMVVNIDTAMNPETYFHRIGRAARFGGQGAAVTLLESDQSVRCFTAMVAKGKIKVKRIKIEDLPYDLPVNASFWNEAPYYMNIKNSTAAPNKDLENVPDREEADKKLRMERKQDEGTVYKYKREEMLKMKDEAEIQEEEKIRIEEKINEEKENQKNQKEPSKTYSEQLEDLKVAMTEKTEKIPETVEKPKAKFKFVPTRQKANKKFYMRGELLSIRESATREEWRKYAESKYNLNEEPFLVVKIDEPQKEVLKPSKSKKNSKNDEKKNKKSPKDNNTPKYVEKKFNDGVLRYNRKQMIQMQMAVPKEAWIPFVKSKYNTNEEPWELDQNMRCSFEERLRRVRTKEKAERKKVMEERKKARENAEQLVSSGRTTRVEEINYSSFEEFCEKINKQFQEYLEREKSGEPTRRVGPVVPLRDPPAVWKYRVNMYARRLEEIENEINYELKLEHGGLKEIEVQTEQLLENIEKESQTDILEVGEKLKEVKIEEEKVNDEAETESEIEMDEEESDDDKEENEEVDEYEIQEEEIERMKQMAESYINNANFNIVYDSYYKMMNSINRQ